MEFELEDDDGDWELGFNSLLGDWSLCCLLLSEREMSAEFASWEEMDVAGCAGSAF